MKRAAKRRSLSLPLLFLGASRGALAPLLISSPSPFKERGKKGGEVDKDSQVGTLLIFIFSLVRLP